MTLVDCILDLKLTVAALSPNSTDLLCYVMLISCSGAQVCKYGDFCVHDNDDDDMTDYLSDTVQEASA